MANNVLIVGGGGREHAMGWKLTQSDDVDEVFYAPGNAGTSLERKSNNLSINGADKSNFDDLRNLAKSLDVKLVAVGPEQPLVDGITGAFEHSGIRVFGPSSFGADIEADKFFSFDVMEEKGIPQAEGIQCYNIEEASAAIRKMVNNHGVVIKARGLAGGKGVFVCDSEQEALEKIVEHADRFGEQSLISERLVGEEFSVFGFAYGNGVVALPMAFQDHKRAYDGDKGPNTGGMGAYGPAPVASLDTIRQVESEIMSPVIDFMNTNGFNGYTGILYAGMMMAEEGPKVIEFNCRAGDPEWQPAMMLFQGDLYDAMMACAEGTRPDLSMSEGAALCTVLASEGYPGSYEKNKNISGVWDADEIEGVKVFHAGTKWDDGSMKTAGGRVLGVTAVGDTLKEAQDRSYRGVEKIVSRTPNVFEHRTDIGDKGLDYGSS